ncbi:DNA binding domain, excisionase family [Moraxella lacunata]|uniref:DNA binding domain, excisionase family n=1 Tax=Moraxella lacunata TaxID=477 RepID=A0A378QL23_MORLA|nr:DNA binding domain, excisionase family [Moraxella lacunata]
MNRLIGINEAAKRLGVSISTLRRWDETGVLVAERTPKGHRRYDINKLHPNFTIIYPYQTAKRLATHEYLATTKRTI